jgi:predicted DNA-binding ribbon-helix-helix protein
VSVASVPVTKRSLSIAGHRTSISLEDPFWEGAKALAAHRAITLSQLVVEIDAQRGDANLSSALRVAVLAFYRNGGGSGRS